MYLLITDYFLVEEGYRNTKFRECNIGSYRVSNFARRACWNYLR